MIPQPVQASSPELPDVVEMLAQKFPQQALPQQLYLWEYVAYSLFIVTVISLLAYFATRRMQLVPGKLQNIAEVIVGGIDDFVCGILGPQGRAYTPFIGTLFIYILCMNLIGFIPFLKSPTSNLSTTLSLALCVFVYVQYAAIRKLGFLGYLDHLSGRLRGAMAATLILPLFMFCIHLITELIKPFTLALRLRSNLMADDMLLGALSGFGLKGVPLLFFCMMLALVLATVQALVFSLLSTVYFAIFLTEE